MDGTESLKDPDDLTLDHAASHLAVANTIAILLRSIPHHATKRINVIPTEIGAFIRKAFVAAGGSGWVDFR